MDWNSVAEKILQDGQTKISLFKSFKPFNRFAPFKSLKKRIDNEGAIRGTSFPGWNNSC